MANKFNEGDVVVLKSGGPPMTVSSAPKLGQAYYHCRWFKGATAASGNYDEHVLDKYEPPKK